MRLTEDLRAHREGLLAFGFWAIVIYRFGHARLRFRSRFVRIPWLILYVPLAKLSEMLFGITIGARAVIGRRLQIEHHGCIVIHGAAVIGNDCLIRQGVTIGNRSTSAPLEAPRIGDRVNIGAGAKILGGICIGNDVSVGANSVVICDVPDGATVVGVPGRVIKRRIPGNPPPA